MVCEGTIETYSDIGTSALGESASSLRKDRNFTRVSNIFLDFTHPHHNYFRSTFKASNGWLEKFKNRHGIVYLERYVVKLEVSIRLQWKNGRSD